MEWNSYMTQNKEAEVSSPCSKVPGNTGAMGHLYMHNFPEMNTMQNIQGSDVAEPLCKKVKMEIDSPCNEENSKKSCASKLEKLCFIQKLMESKCTQQSNQRQKMEQQSCDEQFFNPQRSNFPSPISSPVHSPSLPNVFYPSAPNSPSQTNQQRFDPMNINSLVSSDTNSKKGTCNGLNTIQANMGGMTISQNSDDTFNGSCSQKTLEKIWSGKLAIENCPKKGKSKDIFVSAFAPNVCSPNVAPLVAQFEGSSNQAKTSWPCTLHINGVCYSNNLHFFKKYSQRVFLLCPENQPGNCETFNFLLQQFNKNGWAGVVTLADSTVLLVPFRQEKLLGIVLSKMNIIHATKNINLTSVSDIFNLSQKYYKDSELRFDEKLIDGFYDPGRGTEFVTLQEYLKQPASNSPREILLVDSSVDKRLNSIVTRATEMLNNFADMESQARVLALFVSNCFGGDFPSPQLCAEEVLKIKQCKNSNVILLGELTRGVCRHRAILYKYLCDKFNIECQLKRGKYSQDSVTGAHAWNVIKLGMQYFVVDIMHEPTQLYCMSSQKAKNYVGDDKMKMDCPVSTPPVVRPELSCRRFLRLPNLREKAVCHERLGRGGYGSVYRITIGGLSCALKKINIGTLTEQQKQVIWIFELEIDLKKYALQEVQVMETIDHENIIHYLGHELLEDKQELHILMELFPFSLGQLIERRRKCNQYFCPSEIKHICIEILNGIDYMHNHQILHRDLKPDNILVDTDENGKINKVKITDFGVCKILNEETNTNQTATKMGTDLYMAPEVHCTGKSSAKSDIWSFGMVLVELLTLAPPYYGLPKEAALGHIKSGELPNVRVEGRNPSPTEQRLHAIVEECLQLCPNKRPPAEQLVINFFRLQCFQTKST